MSEAQINQTPIEAPLNKEKQINHSDVTLVFGQGPVQEYTEGQGELGRTGLNFFSRLNAVAAAEMLIQGKTETVILSGGATGAKKEATEADLMADVIRRRIKARLSEKSKTVDAAQRTRLESILQNGIRIENQSKDTIENFINILNQYIDDGKSVDGKIMTLLGTGFHAQDTHSGAGIGRLEKLAEIFDVKGQVVSAEDILRTLPAKNRSDGSYIVKELDRLTQMATDHEVAQGKSRQEKILVELLDRGDWIAKAAGATNPERLRNMLEHSPFALELVQKARQCTLDEALTLVRNSDLSNLQEMVRQISPLVKEDRNWQDLQAQYGKTKGEVLTDFESLRNTRIASLISQSPEFAQQVSKILDVNDISTLDPNELLQSARIKAAELRTALKQLSVQMEEKKGKDATLIEQRVRLLSQLKPLDDLLKEDRYADDKSYMMQYGKGEDPRNKDLT